MSANRKVTPSLLLRKKRRGEKITLLTAYDYPMARFINQAGVDIILVSDAVGTVGNGRPEAVSVSVDEMIYHTQAVRNGAGNSMVVTTLPFGSYETINQAVETAVRLMKEGGADAVHFEGTSAQGDSVKAIVEAGIPVLGHIGIIKQKIVRSGCVSNSRPNGRFCTADTRRCGRVCQCRGFWTDFRMYTDTPGRDYHPELGDSDDWHWSGIKV